MRQQFEWEECTWWCREIWNSWKFSTVWVLYFLFFLPLMISRVSHCGMHVQSAQTKINNFISFFRNIKLTLVVTNKKCDSHKVMYYRIYIIAMTAKFTGLVWALFRRRWLVSQKYQQPNNNAVSAHCSHNDYLMRSCFASATGCSTHLSAKGVDHRRETSSANYHLLHTQTQIQHTEEAWAIHTASGKIIRAYWSHHVYKTERLYQLYKIRL